MNWLNWKFNSDPVLVWGFFEELLVTSMSNIHKILSLLFKIT